MLYISGSWTAAAAGFISGVFIDIDHLLDYYLRHGFNFNIRKFFETCYEHQFRHVVVLFHSYELLLIFWVSIFTLKLGVFWIAAALGLTQHVILDQIAYSGRNSKPLRYFFLYRLKHGFGLDIFHK